MNTMKKFIIPSMTALTLVAAITWPAAVFAQDKTQLVIAIPGGTYEEGWREAIIVPFEAANPDVEIQVVQGNTFQNLATARAQKDNVKVDVLLMDEVAATQASAEGLLEPLSTETVPNLADVYPQFRVEGDPYMKFGFSTGVLAYDVAAFTEAPKSFSDLLDPKLAQKIAIPNLDTNTGVLFFLALNQANGGTLDNIDPGLAAAKKLRPAANTFWTQHAQLSQLFTAGDVVLAPWVSDRVTGLQNLGVGIDWIIAAEGAVITEGALVLAKGSSQSEIAKRYMNFVLSPETQARNAEVTYVSPVNSKVVLDAETAKKVPNGLDMVNAAIRPNWSDVAAHLPNWIERWSREVTQ